MKLKIAAILAYLFVYDIIFSNTQITTRLMTTMIREIKVGKIYQHYKGHLYEVIAIARNSENPESKLVIYKALYNSLEFGKEATWSRDYKMFAEKIIINGIEQDRFKEV